MLKLLQKIMSSKDGMGCLDILIIIFDQFGHLGGILNTLDSLEMLIKSISISDTPYRKVEKTRNFLVTLAKLRKFLKYPTERLFDKQLAYSGCIFTAKTHRDDC